MKNPWSRLVVILLGLWLICAPGTFGYEAPFTPSLTGISPQSAHATYYLALSDIITGVIAIILGLLSLKGRVWPLWIVALLGIWLQFAPLIFWSPKAVIYLNDTIIGMLLIVFSILVTKLPDESWSSDKVVPAGWSYNPSSGTQRIPVIFFGFLGWFISRYLSAYQMGYIPTVWDPFFGEGTLHVITSNLSKSFPVSDAGLGALAYGLEALMGCKGGAGRWRTMPWMVVVFGLLVVPLGLVSILLVMSQPIIVGAWCGLCLITAGGMLIMLALTVDEVLAVCQFMKTTDKPFWKAFWEGGEQAGALEDRSPFTLKSMVYGVSIPFNLLLTALLGLWIIASPAVLHLTGLAANNNHIFGALIAVFSIIAWAEVARGLRYANILIAGWIIISVWLLDIYNTLALVNNILAALALIFLSVRKGHIKESYGSWQIH
ncbi:MAG: vitamin K epoxide reductase family protein [Chlamydiota bacterium]